LLGKVETHRFQDCDNLLDRYEAGPGFCNEILGLGVEQAVELPALIEWERPLRGNNSGYYRSQQGRVIASLVHAASYDTEGH